MKIEKLTENKIRVIVKPSDLEVKEDIDVHTLMSKIAEGQNFFLHLLEKAKKEVGFNTDGCKLLIEAFSSSENILIFTITKYSSRDSESPSITTPKRLTVKRKSINLKSNQAIYQFQDFDRFCDFCRRIHDVCQFPMKQISKDISLYFYHNTYYLVIKNIHLSDEQTSLLKSFDLIASEFFTPVHFSNSFENKLLEHGKLLMKKNAITTGIKYFVDSNYNRK